MPDETTVPAAPEVRTPPTEPAEATPEPTGNQALAPAHPRRAGHRCRTDGCRMTPTASGWCVNHDPARKAAMQEARSRGGVTSVARTPYGLDAAWRPNLADDKGIITAAEDLVAGVATGRLSAAAATAAGAILRVAVETLRERRDVDLAELAARLEEQARKH